MRRQVLAFLASLAAGALPLGAAAAPSNPQNGVEYLTLPEVQATDGDGKVEVIEFFAYYCPHCNAFEPLLSEWVRKNSDKVVFKRIHVANGPQVEPQQRLFYTLEAMGLLPQYHERVFAAMHGRERNRMNTDETVFNWAEKNGIDRAKFIDVYRSFGIAARLRRTAAMTQAYRVSSWPLLAIDGRWITSPYQASQGLKEGTEEQQQKAALQVLDFLVAKARAERK